MAINNDGQRVVIDSIDIDNCSGYAIILTDGYTLVEEISVGRGLSYIRPRSNFIQLDEIFIIVKNKGIRKYSLNGIILTMVNDFPVLDSNRQRDYSFEINFTDFPRTGSLLTERQWIVVLNYIFEEYHSTYSFRLGSTGRNTIGVNCDADGNSTNPDSPYCINTEKEIYEFEPFILLHEIIHHLLIKKGTRDSYHRDKGVMRGADNGLYIDLRSLLKIHGYNNNSEPASQGDLLSNIFLPSRIEFWQDSSAFIDFVEETNFTFTNATYSSFSSIEADYSSINPYHLLKQIIFARKKRAIIKYSSYIKKKTAFEWDYLSEIPEIGELGIEKKEYIKNSIKYYEGKRFHNTLLALVYLIQKYGSDKKLIKKILAYLSKEKINSKHLPKLMKKPWKSQERGED